MADIKSYLKEKEKREQNQLNYKEKIRKHKLTALYRVLLVLAAVGALVALVILQYQRHIYTDYDTVSALSRETAGTATDIRLGDAILTYSQDGAHCTNLKGEVTWNRTYEMQDIRIAVCDDVAAIGNYNGRSIYVQNTQEQLGEITTTMPIRDIAVSATGCVTAVLADTDVTWINTYAPTGEMLYTGQAHMYDSGYPVSVSLSPSAELLGVSYIYVDAGVLKTNIAFYNFGAVGENQSDHIVSVYSYSDLLVPYIQFMNDSTAFAVGDTRLMMYTGSQKPVVAAEYLYEKEIQSVFFSDRYVGLVFLSDDTASAYQMDVYDVNAQKVGSYYFDVDYTDIFFSQDYFVAYNETECEIITLGGVEKFKGTFDKTVRLMIPAGGTYKYAIVTENSIDTIQLK